MDKSPRAVHTCPSCGSEDVERVPRRRTFERLLTTLMRRRAYQCVGCGHRFYDARRAA